MKPFGSVGNSLRFNNRNGQPKHKCHLIFTENSLINLNIITPTHSNHTHPKTM